MILFRYDIDRLACNDFYLDLSAIEVVLRPSQRMLGLLCQYRLEVFQSKPKYLSSRRRCFCMTTSDHEDVVQIMRFGLWSVDYGVLIGYSNALSNADRRHDKT